MTDNLETLDSTQDTAPTSPESSNEPASETVRETLNKVLANREIGTQDATPNEIEPEEAETEEVETESEAELEEVKEGEPEEKEEKPLEAIKPPQHWPNDFKEQFESMGATGQHLFMKRYKDLEGDYTKKTQGLAKYRKRQEAFDELMSPFKGDFERAGMDDVGAVRQLLAAHDYLRKDPKQAIGWLAKNYGVDISEVGIDSTENEDYADPEVKALKQQVAQLQNFLQAQQNQQTQSVQSSTQSMIDQFAQEKDANGNAKHPHFDNVRDRMGVLIQANQAPDLASAYDMAVYADPKIRQEMLDRYALNKSQNEVKTEAVAKAKKAQRSTVRGSAGPSEMALSSNLSVRDTILQSINQLENGRK
tara:strand:- start:688 stop:1776 length:1089 start_codon:yes stop_codon:yes gene_type:complete